MLWKFNSVYNPELQLADHARPVRYEMAPPPAHRDVIDPGPSTSSAARRPAAHRRGHEEFVEQTRMGGKASG